MATRVKIALIYFGAVIIALLMAEAYYAGVFNFGTPIKNLKADVKVISGKNIQGHKILGYAPSANSSYLINKYYGDSLLYKYSQTIDKYGLRKNQSPDSSSWANAALFFGDSFTFGEGVEDHETSSSIFQNKSHGKFKAINYAYIGYGPHQTLALLENNLEKKPLSGLKPQVGILQIIPDHVFRVADKSGWDFFGPEYKISEKTNKLVYNGAFNNNITGKIKSFFFRSHLVKNIFYRNREYSYDDVELLAKVVKESYQIFNERYGNKFYVILWQLKESESDLYSQILTQLCKLGVPVIEIKDILPDYSPNSSKYIIQFDNHPNKYTHKLLGEYLYELVQK
ncbi:MAG TPA: hypothetical protein DEO59_08995 [Balneola sp.]|nr:hypothetical protein [Balneola sp.]